MTFENFSRESTGGIFLRSPAQNRKMSPPWALLHAVDCHQSDALAFATTHPQWLGSVVAKVSLIAAWAGLIITVRREFLERVRLKFRFKTTYVEEDDRYADVCAEIDGVPVVDGVLVTITSKGRGITIEQFQCEYRSSSGEGLRAITATAHLGEHIGHGKACEGRLKIYSQPTRFTSAVAVDSTGKPWRCSRRELKRLNDESVLWWSKKPFQRQESSSDKRLTEKRRAKQQATLALESAAALQSAQDHQRTIEMKRKLYNLLRRINWIEVDFQFPPGAGRASASAP